MTKEEAIVDLRVNNQAAIDDFNKLEEKATRLKKKFSEAFARGDTRGVQAVNDQLKKVNKEMQQARTNAGNIRAAMVRLNEATPRELQRAIKAINTELNSGRVVRGSKEWDAYIEQLERAKAELRSLQHQQELTTGMLTRMKNKINDWGAAIAAGMAAFAGVVMSGKAAVQTYADMQQEEANVRKYTGMTAEEVKKLNDEFKRIDTRTSREELNKLAQEAGRLGKTSQEDVLGFVRAANQINVALDDLGQGATLTLSKLTGIFGDDVRYGTEKSLLKVGSVINELSQNCSASAPYLAEFASRMGGVASQAGMSIQQVMAFGAVLDENNQKLEASSTAVSQVLVRLYQEPAKYARVAGLDVQKFTELMKRDANEALITFLSTLQKAGGMDVLSPMFKDMGETGSRAISALSTLAANIDKVKWQQQEANKAFAEGVSITNEYDVQNTTVQAGLEKARKGFTEMAVALGEELLPVMRYCISGTSMLMKVMLQLITFSKNHTKELIILTAAIAGYTIAVKAAIIAEKTRSAAIAVSMAATKGLNAAMLLATAATSLFTGNTRKARLAMVAFNASIKANPIAMLVSVLFAAGAALVSYITRTNEARKASREAAAEKRREMEEYRKGLTSLSSQAKQYASGELTRLQQLYKTTTNVNKAGSKRLAAARELLRLYPDYFKKMSEEDLMLGRAIGQYQLLRKSIIEAARAKAAQDKIQSNESEKLDLELSFEDANDKAAERWEVLDKLEEKLSKARKAMGGGNKDMIEKVKNLKAAIQVVRDDIEGLYDMAYDAATKMGEIDRANEKLAKKYGGSAEKVEIKGAVDISGPRELSDKEKKALEKAAKAAEAAKKKALQAELKETRDTRDRELAVNTASYSAGLKDYREYMAERQRIEVRFLDDQMSVYAKYGMEEEAEYGQLLKKKEDLLAKHIEQNRKLSLREIERSHNTNVDDLTSQYFDPRSTMYQNDKGYYQAMLAEDINYLEARKALYEAGAEEWEDIEYQIQERIAQDKLRKQEEMAEAYMQFEEQYRNAVGGRRMQLELSMLEQLQRDGFITWEEYLQAKEDMEDEYRDKDRERLRRTQSEYADMVLNIWGSFSKLFKDIADGGSFSFDKLASAAQAAFTVMGASLQQYSNYVNAERDLELAKAEARYDKEIERAGNNTRKKEKLEKQKEAATAKIKKKYNDKAMKIEMAQALAQTATAAIAAYASAAAIPITGWIMAPIAAALATAAGMVQVATIRKQHQAEAAGYYSGGFTARDRDNRKEVGVVHANEFVANHEAVSNPAIAPLLRLIDHAQRNNTVGTLTRQDVSNALGQGSGVSARGVAAGVASPVVNVTTDMSEVSGVMNETSDAIRRLNRSLDQGIEADVVMDGERGLKRKLDRYNKLRNNPRR